MEADWPILVVEDQQESSTPLCAILEAEGYECHVAATGREAIELVETIQPRVILLDIGLPDISGTDILDRLHRGTSLDDCRVVAITGHDDGETRRRCREAGVNLFFSKPIDPDDLLRTLRALEES